MRTSSRWLIGSALALVACGAWANGARIVFHGAVVEPTCAVNAAALPTANANPTRQVCGQTATAIGTRYASRTVTVDAVTAANDRLLAYFANNQLTASADPAPAKLVVRTYD